MQRHICQVNNFDHFYHTIQLLFDLLKRNIVARNADRHSRNRLIFCRSDRQALQVIGFAGKQSGNLCQNTHIIFDIKCNPSVFHIRPPTLKSYVSWDFRPVP